MLAGENMTDQALLAAEQLKEEKFIDSWLQHRGQVRAEDADLYNDLVISGPTCMLPKPPAIPAGLSKNGSHG